MAKEYWTITQVVEYFEVDEGFLEALEAERIIRATQEEDPALRRFCADELEKLRLAKLLMEDLNVNMPGVEVILRMRRNLVDMRNQFDDILHDLSQRFHITPRDL